MTEWPPTVLTWLARGRAGLRTYGVRIRQFSRNARLYIVATVVSATAFGIYRLIFNFYVLGLGYDRAFLGEVLTVNSFVTLLAAIPAGYVGDRLGRKITLLLGGTISALAVVGMVVWRSAPGLLVTNVLFGLGQSLGAVTLGPFLMENSGEEERTYLFAFVSGLQMVAASIGNWLGGWLPGLLGPARGVGATHPDAYAMAMLGASGLALLGVGPFLLLRRRRLARPGVEYLSPLRYARSEPRHLGRLVAPMLITSIGAGLFMPFMNVFFRVQHHRSDAVIGSLLALGSLAMALGLLAAPPLAERFGKVRMVVVSQALSIPFLVILGYAPLFWLSAAAYLVRLALMNMSNPLYQSFVMEQVEEGARATVASLVSMAWSFGWAFSPIVSGRLQEQSGFGMVYALVIVLYCAAIYMYWRFFLWPVGRAEAHRDAT